ncbi:MAG: hypothetical protein J7M38_00305 [Armatimonadetes bacterium]|nr:hypothetical protein [Armatimonadota bacterium]
MKAQRKHKEPETDRPLEVSKPLKYLPANEEEERTRFQYTLLPKWIEFSGIAAAWGRRTVVPTVYLAIIRADHLTDGMMNRRHGTENKTFAMPHDDLAQMTGVYIKTVGRVARELLDVGLLEVYYPGRTRIWSHFQVNRGPLLQLYQYVAPRLRRMHGGIHNAGSGDGALGATQIYGVENGSPPDPMVCDEITMLKLWKQRPAEPEWPDPAEVANILGI